MISTKGRYAIRMVVDLAQNRNGSFIPLKDIAARQEISLKYLERIALTLTQSSLVESSHGKGGGYRLNRDPENVSVLDILLAIEGDIAPVSCLSCNAPACPRAGVCTTLDMWKGYHKLTQDYFGSITIASLAQHKAEPDYVI